MRKEIDITRIVEEMGLQGKDVDELAENEDFIKTIEKMFKENPKIFNNNAEDLMINIFAMQCMIATLDPRYLYLLGNVLEDVEFREDVSNVHTIDDIEISFLKAKSEYKQGFVSIETVKYKAYIYILAEKTVYEISKDGGLERLYEILESTLLDYSSKITKKIESSNNEKNIKLMLDRIMLETLSQNINKFGIVTEQEVQALLGQEFETGENNE